MDFEVGIRLNTILENQDKIIEALRYIVAALEDNNLKPKEEKNEEQSIKKK